MGKDKLQHHKKTAHNEDENANSLVESIKCDICHEDFSKKSALKTHRDNAHKKSLKCDFCLEEFPKKTELKTHVENIHHPGK